MKPTEQQIKEIADELTIGMRSYFHRQSGKVLSLPSEEMLEYDDEEPWQETIDALEGHRDEYVEVVPMSSREGYRIMENFADSLSDERFRQRLWDALNGAKPFANFKFRVEDSDYRENWFAFRDAAYLDYVRKILEE